MRLVYEALRAKAIDLSLSCARARGPLSESCCGTGRKTAETGRACRQEEVRVGVHESRCLPCEL